jgi:excisionase family DNA binding protein
MKLSMSQAAKEIGMSKTTVHRAIKNGKLSAEKDGSQYKIDPAELFRAFPKNSVVTSQGNELNSPTETGETAKDVEIRMLREMLDAKDQQIDDLRMDKQRLLADQRPLWRKLFK